MLFTPDVFGRRNVFDDFFDFPTMPAARQSSDHLMKTDVREMENAYELTVDLPGIKKEDVNAKLDDGYLTITATTSQNNDEKDKNGKYIRRERFSGSYSRSFYVGEGVKEDDIKAKFDNGVLTLDVPKIRPEQQKEQTRYIAIQ